ncbi:MAG: hypothetical protein AAF420_13465, partial [Pseudomonadota bacterium]
MKRKLITQLLAGFTLLATSLVAWGEIDIVHDPVDSAISGSRITLNAEVTAGDDKIEVVRAYFKSSAAKRFHYVTMRSQDDASFSAELPSPRAGVGSIEYFLLAKNDQKKIVKTQNFTADIEDVEVSSSAAQQASEDVVRYRDVDGYHGKVVRAEGSISVVSATGAKRSLKEAGYVVTES